MKAPTINEIRESSERIKPFVHVTPILTCRTLNQLCGSQIFFKCENFQKAGAFKIRGATNAVFVLGQREASRGVATHSSGNHAAALALAARWRGIKAHVVMPENSTQVKKNAVLDYGAQVIFCKPTLQAREESLAQVLEATHAAPIHPYNDERVIAGQGTCALEFCTQVPGLDVVIAPVGGGGLISGTGLAVSAVSPKTRVIAAEPEKADDAYRSFHAGRIIPSDKPETIADGLRTSLGDLTFPIIQRYVEDILTVSEDAIAASMRSIWERMKIIVEPSAAVPLGALMRNRSRFVGKRVGIILSGGNTDLARLPWTDFGTSGDR